MGDTRKRILTEEIISTQSTRSTSIVSDHGKLAHTEVVTVAHLSKAESSRRHGDKPGSDQSSLVALKLHTGRTHQIRVHMLAIGHPLMCDAVYARCHILEDR